MAIPFQAVWLESYFFKERGAKRDQVCDSAVKLLVIPSSHPGVLVWDLAAVLPMLLPPNMLGKTVENNPYN